MTRPAETISLAEIYDALGETGPFALHAHDPNPECTVGAGIRPVLSSIYAGVTEALARELSARTIADVLDEILANDPTEMAPHATRK
jgi:DNA-binding IscR family transcriptional regulator